MRILAISLLRLGDLILQRPLFEGLRQKHPGCEVHVLINKQFSGIEFLFEDVVDRFIYFDRETLQKSCGEKEFSIFWGVQQLKRLVQQLNNESYEEVYNLTHNRMTAQLCGLINAKNHHGIFAKAGEFFGLSNPWIRFFNSYFGRAEAAGFHYTELLANALEISLPEKASMRLERPKSLILIQAMTSDAKKNWGLEKIQQLAENLSASSSYTVYVLGAPFEKEALSKVISEGFLKITTLKEAASLLKQSAVLVTGDTSIKHLAAIYEVPTLELSLGSSQPLQVGAYCENSIILQSRVSCGPCPHSVPCGKPRHYCGDEISVAAVQEAVQTLLGREQFIWQNYAYEHPELRVFKTEIRPVIGWSVACLSVSDKSKFDEVLQQKTMVVEELNRRHQASKGVSSERTERTRKVSDRSPEAS